MLNGGGVIQEESPRTQYVPPEPRISVLSRPKKKSAEDMSNGKSKKEPVKTLEQVDKDKYCCTSLLFLKVNRGKVGKATILLIYFLFLYNCSENKSTQKLDEEYLGTLK